MSNLAVARPPKSPPFEERVDIGVEESRGQQIGCAESDRTRSGHRLDPPVSSERTPARRPRKYELRSAMSMRIAPNMRWPARRCQTNARQTCALAAAVRYARGTAVAFLRPRNRGDAAAMDESSQPP